VVDVVCLEEAKKQDEAGRKLIKGSRYLLLKNAPNLLGSQRKALRELLAANKALNTVYVLKDQLKRIWDYKHPAWARKALDQWCALAHRGLDAMDVSFARPPLARRLSGLHADHPRHARRRTPAPIQPELGLLRVPPGARV
jgi:transposase